MKAALKPAGAAAVAPRIQPTAAADAELMQSLYQKQAKIYPRAVTGVFARWRVIMVVLTQLVFYGLPWLTWNGRQAVLFDLDTPAFHLWGLTLQPQDLIYLAALLVISALALFFFTAVAGRLWCGYACPQTVYTEMFLWIERQTEGDRHARMRLDAQPWGWNKLRRKAAKHGLWALLALVTGFSFTGYFIPIRELAAQAMSLSLTPWALFWTLFYGLATYGNAGWMREQICKYMCPYARFQSTLIDADSMVIAYDNVRGEPRGARSRKADRHQLGLGSCIDCTLCVQVCPTGIDIRHGLQNECIGCAACIDVCDDVMAKMGEPPGLIRYATANGVAQGLSRAEMLRRVARPRVLVYGLLLALSVAAFAWGLAHREPVMMNVLRDRGVMARELDDGRIENVYRLQLTHRQATQAEFELQPSGLPGLKLEGSARLSLGPDEAVARTVRLSLPAGQAAPGPHAIHFTLRPAGGGAVVVTEKSSFLVP